MSYVASGASPPHTREEEAPEQAKVRHIGKTRVQFDLTMRAMKLLTELKEKTEASSYAEVVKNALKLYDGLIAEADRGSEFLIRDKQGNISSFKMFL